MIQNPPRWGMVYLCVIRAIFSLKSCYIHIARQSEPHTHSLFWLIPISLITNLTTCHNNQSITNNRLRKDLEDMTLRYNKMANVKRAAANEIKCQVSSGGCAPKNLELAIAMEVRLDLHFVSCRWHAGFYEWNELLSTQCSFYQHNSLILSFPSFFSRSSVPFSLCSLRYVL